MVGPCAKILTCSQSKLPYRHSSVGKQVHTPYGQKDDAGPIGGISGTNIPSDGPIGGGPTGGNGYFIDQPHPTPAHDNIIPQPHYDSYGGYGGNSYVP